MIKFLVTLLTFNSEHDKNEKKTDVGIYPLFISPFGHVYFSLLLKFIDYRLPVLPLEIVACVLSSCFLRQLNGVEEKRDANREIKNAPSALLSSRVFLKIPKCLYNSTMLEEQVFIFLL